MASEKFSIGNLTCTYCRAPESGKIAYVLYPMDSLESWIEDATRKYNVTIVVITGMSWDNDLTPWAAPGVPKGTPAFQGLAPEFFRELTETVVPAVEKRMGVTVSSGRTLVGVSLSGLFTLWQWAQSDFFHNIATLSGSYWYDDFVQWIWAQSFTDKTGKCFMLLGDAEPHSPNPVFATVGKCTEDIVGYLRRQKVNVTYMLVKGNHYQYPLQRLDMALGDIFPLKN